MQLYQELEEYLSSIQFNAANLVVMVRVYTDLQTLGQRIKEKHSQDLGTFVHGFNDEEITFDLVDVGPSVKDSVRKVESKLPLPIFIFLKSHQ